MACFIRDAFCSLCTAGSSLFYRIAKISDPKQMLPAILSEMEEDPAYAFLQSHDGFKELIFGIIPYHDLTVEELIEPYNRKILILPIIAASWRIYEAYFDFV